MARHRQVGAVSGFPLPHRVARKAIVAADHMHDDTAGGVLLWDASGAPLVQAPGTDGQVLYTRGAGAVASMGWMLRTLETGEDATERTTTSVTYTLKYDLGITAAAPAAGAAYAFISFECELKYTRDNPNSGAGLRLGDANYSNFWGSLGMNVTEPRHTQGVYYPKTTLMWLPADGAVPDVQTWIFAVDQSGSEKAWYRNAYWHYFALYPNP